MLFMGLLDYSVGSGISQWHLFWIVIKIRADKTPGRELESVLILELL